MNKKVIALIICILVIAIASITVIINNTENTNTNVTNNEEEYAELNTGNTEGEETENNNSKVAVIYFSATKTTETIAKYISEETGANLIEIEAKQPYTSEDLDYNTDCRANKEQNDESSRPEIANVINVDDYDVIYLGYPIWWGTNPKIILTFLDSYNLNGKTIIPFCTSGGSGISQSERDLASYNSNINWINGRGFSSSSTKSDVSSWLNSLSY